MLAGWAVATWASQRDLALPFAQQDPPLSPREAPSGTSGTIEPGETPAALWRHLPENWAKRKSLARTRFAPAPGGTRASA